MTLKSETEAVVGVLRERGAQSPPAERARKGGSVAADPMAWERAIARLQQRFGGRMLSPHELLAADPTELRDRYLFASEFEGGT